MPGQRVDSNYETVHLLHIKHSFFVRPMSMKVIWDLGGKAAAKKRGIVKSAL